MRKTYSNKTIGDVIDTMNTDQKNVLYYLLGEVIHEQALILLEAQRIKSTEGSDPEDDEVL